MKIKNDKKGENNKKNLNLIFNLNVLSNAIEHLHTLIKISKSHSIK